MRLAPFTVMSMSVTTTTHADPKTAAEGNLPVCEVCGNDYDKSFAIVRDGVSHVFDCFECAIHALAPRCAHCGCAIIGHGSEAAGAFYCCAHCASREKVRGIADRA